MNTERHAWWSTRVLTLAERRTPPVCGCGQDLDATTRTHCPRCGACVNRYVA